MKRFNILLVFLIVLSGCFDHEGRKGSKEREDLAETYKSFGQEFSGSSVKTNGEMAEVYRKMHEDDTLGIKFRATVTDVCRAKGCWMKLQLGEGRETMVRFKDYGFFVPRDIVGKEVIVNGLAFVEYMGVEEQRHFAKDAGLSEDEVAKITAPKSVFGFEAEGVLLVD